VEEGQINPQEALNNASNPNDLRLKLQGQGDAAAAEIGK
jgi:Tfp pilus assembly ATPase PilU